MMISFDFLSKPLELNDDKINVLCIENRHKFRNIFLSFYDGTFEDNGVCVSENYSPIKGKNITEVIYNYFSLDLSNSSVKKIFEQLSLFCHNEMSEETSNLHKTIIEFMDKLCSNFDYDFDYSDELDMTAFLKSQSLHLNLNNHDAITNLLDYILLVNKYCSKKLFILFYPHAYFTSVELDKLYEDVLKRNIKILVIEGTKYFHNSKNEKYIIFDEDMCEIC